MLSGLVMRASVALRSARAVPVLSGATPSAGRATLRTARSLAVSAYQDDQDNATVGEVDFDQLPTRNSITLVGNTGRDVEVKYLASGNKVANVAIALNDAKGNASWVDVEAWGDLAENARDAVKKGSLIAVEGKLKIDSWQDKQTNQTKKAYRIVARTITKVRPSMRPVDAWNPTADQGWDAPEQQQQQRQQPAQQVSLEDQWQDAPATATAPRATAAATGAGLQTAEEQWMSYFEEPEGWYDNRASKESGQINPRSPDFKRKDGGRDAPALWITSKSTPAWVVGELSKRDQGAEGAPF